MIGVRGADAQSGCAFAPVTAINGPPTAIKGEGARDDRRLTAAVRHR